MHQLFFYFGLTMNEFPVNAVNVELCIRLHKCTPECNAHEQQTLRRISNSSLVAAAHIIVVHLIYAHFSASWVDVTKGWTEKQAPKFYNCITTENVSNFQNSVNDKLSSKHKRKVVTTPQITPHLKRTATLFVEYCDQKLTWLEICPIERGICPTAVL